MSLHGLTSVEIWADWIELNGPRLMGTLSFNFARGQEIFSFSYDQSWLDSKFTQILDPGLKFYAGPQYNETRKANFGLFLDSAPDRWGRTLQKRRAAIRAREQGEKEPRLVESDFLLGVYDHHRMGALRFRSKEAGIFLNDDDTFAVPPMASLRELEVAAQAIESEDEHLISEEKKWVRMLIAPGGSLGGARPKASVKSQEGELWIAKFPSGKDTYDLGLWEYLVYLLAKESGINVAESKTKVFKGPEHTFLTKRFDRSGEKRIHFASAMTMLDKTDGTGGEDGTSYLEIVEFLVHNGANVNQDLEELWKRIVFSMCVSNTDDHLRNHGFLLTDEGWILSPAFDINANPDGDGLKLNVSEVDNGQDFSLALSVAPYFRLTEKKANELLVQITTVVKTWKEKAAKLKISRAEIQKMQRAFRMGCLS